MNSLKDGTSETNVARWSESEATNEAGAEIGDDVTVQIGHDQDVVLGWILHHIQTHCVQVFLLKSVSTNVMEQKGLLVWTNRGVPDFRILLSSLTATPKEKAVRHSHDVGLVNRSNLGSTIGLGVVKGKLGHATRCVFRDELDALDDSIDNFVFDARVFT